MAFTAFGNAPQTTLTAWEMEVWKQYRDNSYWTKFSGTNGNSPVHRFEKLTMTNKGTRSVFQLVGDLKGDGVVGDNTREGNEEAMAAQEQIVNVDQISHSVRSEGDMAEQGTVIEFRETAKDRLGAWLADRVDQLMFLSASGISFNKTTNGADRAADSQFPTLNFAADVKAPSSLRSLMYNGTSLLPSVTGNITTAFLPSYDMLTMLAAYAKARYIKPIRQGGKEYYIMVVRPETMAAFRRDATFKNALSGVDVGSNPIFTGSVGSIAGIVLHEHNLVYNTTGAASGQKWGAGGAINGTRSLLLGAQALGLCDLGAPKWVEKQFDYDNQSGINIKKMIGIIKPQFANVQEGTTQDFGIIAVDHFLPQ